MDMAVKSKISESGAHVDTSRRKGPLPTKNSINFAYAGVKPFNWMLFIPMAVLIIAAAALFGKFGVADVLSPLSAVNSEVSSLQSQLDSVNARIDAFGALNETYAHYSYSGMTEEELGRVGRVEIMELIQKFVIPSVTLESWSVTGNTLTLSVGADTLQDVNMLSQKLMTDDIVDFCSVTTARTNDNETVEANVLVYLNSADKGVSAE